MIARRLGLTVVVSLCGLVCLLAVCVAPAAASVTSFGSGGTEAGQLEGGTGVGLDQETGDVYVGEFYDERVSKFDGVGDFLLAWGWRVNKTAPAEQLQTCTAVTECQKGLSGSGSGEFASECGAQGVAVDDDPSSAYFHDVYVEDYCNHRVQVLKPSGEFVLMFGGHVNEAKDSTLGATQAEEDVCVAGEKCTSGTEGAANGEFEWSYAHSTIAVGPDGTVYVGDRARYQVFDASGAWRESVSLAGLSSTGKVTAIAVNSARDVFVVDEEVAGVREFEPSGVEKLAALDAGSVSVEALAADGAGDVFIADAAGGLHFLEYDSVGEETASFGAKTVSNAKGIAFSDALEKLYVSDGSSVWVLSVSPPGPVIETGSESATPGLGGAATLEAKLDPEGNETTFHFEYVSEAQYQTSGYAQAARSTSASAGSGFEEQVASTVLTKLAPGVYHYRIVATNAKGVTTGPDQTFSTALIEGPSATDVSNTSATLSARIDPSGLSTEYRLEYGTSASYGYAITGSVGEGSGYVPIGVHEQGLQASTVYHYRLVISTEYGSYATPDYEFVTQAGGTELALLDGRAWELVSPPDKKGALIEPFLLYDEIQAASDGSGITYLTQGPHVGENPRGKGYFSQVLSIRGPGGWSSQDLNLPVLSPEEGVRESSIFSLVPEYPVFSSSLSLAVVEPLEFATPLLSPEATERTIYLRNNTSGGYTPLVTAANVPPGVHFGGLDASQAGGAVNGAHEGQLDFVAATPDLGHVIVKSPLALTTEAVGEDGLAPGAREQQWNLYEWGGGQLRLVNILPDGEPAHGIEPGVRLAGQISSEAGFVDGSVPRAISVDGRRVAWTIGNPYGLDNEGYRGLYVRDMVEKKTVRVGNRPTFQTMSSDGSKIFFTENGELYVYDWGTGVETDLTASHGSSEANAGVQQLVSDVSEDGASVYFVATGALAPGGASGEYNLYLLHESGGTWSTTYIATLSDEDEKDWGGNGHEGRGEGLGLLPYVSSRVSPSGRYLAFMSDRPLTGYDNIDAVSGRRDEEVYLYDSVAGRLTCASCNPTGARPVGVLDQHTHELPDGELIQPLLGDSRESWNGSEYGGERADPWLAGSIPGWDKGFFNDSQYQPRYLSDSGRLFFESPDALVPQDTNGLEDVYEYEPAGVGGCTATQVTFSARSDGCVGLISSGVSSLESAFFDASENGDDAFFITASKLVPEDYDNGYDVYDAHVCSTEVPCVSSPVASPPCTSGDSCKAAPSPQPLIFGPAPSATFSGSGNIVEEAKKSVVKRKAKPKKHAKKKRKKKDKKNKSKALKKAKGTKESRPGASGKDKG